MAIIGSGGRRQVRSGTRGAGGWRRIAVLLEPGASGTATLERGFALAREHEAELTVVAVAPQAERPRCAGPSPEGYNDAVRDTVGGELAAARAHAGASARYVLLVEHRDQPLARWLDAEAIDLVMLPRRWPPLGRPRHPAARGLRRSVSAEVRVIAP